MMLINTTSSISQGSYSLTLSGTGFDPSSLRDTSTNIAKQTASVVKTGDSFEPGLLSESSNYQPVQKTSNGDENSTPDTSPDLSNTTGGTEETAASGELTTEQKDQISQLTTLDREVRSHEQSHIAVGGNLVRGGASFQYQTGPDGKRYAVGGEVNIDTSPVRDDPQATMAKAEHIKRTALAPAKPSPQDYHVASQATSMAAQASVELARKKYQEATAQTSQNPLPVSSAAFAA